MRREMGRLWISAASERTTDILQQSGGFGCAGSRLIDIPLGGSKTHPVSGRESEFSVSLWLHRLRFALFLQIAERRFRIKRILSDRENESAPINQFVGADFSRKRLWMFSFCGSCRIVWMQFNLEVFTDALERHRFFTKYCYVTRKVWL